METNYIELKKQYDEYIEDHKLNVKCGFKWIKANTDILKDCSVLGDIEYNILHHDASKYEKEEFYPYAEYFYGNASYEVTKNFKYAWLHHIHTNKHHWQYWVLINDDEGTVALEMPYEYVIEMICDWWAFSWKKMDLYEIFDWYDEHKKKMILHDKQNL